MLHKKLVDLMAIITTVGDKTFRVKISVAHNVFTELNGGCGLFSPPCGSEGK